MSHTHYRKIGLLALTMLITGSIDSIRNMPTVALFGASLLFYLPLSLIFFLWPITAISAELAASWSDKEAGIYAWVRQAFGDRAAILVVWLQWVNTVAWFPTVLSFIAGTAAYLIMPSLATNRFYLVSVIVVTFWLLTLINLKGFYLSAIFAELCTIFGMLLPLGGLIVLAIVWLATGHASQLHLSLANIMPTQAAGFGHLLSLTALITAYLGIELSAVHMPRIENAKKTFPRALFLASLIIVVTMLLGPFAIATVLPIEKISLVSGIMQTFDVFLGFYRLKALMPWISLLVLLGALGSTINWLISPARGLAQIAEHGFLPRALAKRNAAGVNHVVLVMQAVIVTIIAVLLFALTPTVNGSYWLLTDLSTELYVMMYILVLLAAIALRKKQDTQAKEKGLFKRDLTYYGMCALGLIGCVVVLVVGFIPPTDIAVGGAVRFEWLFSLGILILLSPIVGILAYGRRAQQRNTQEK